MLLQNWERGVKRAAGKVSPEQVRRGAMVRHSEGELREELVRLRNEHRMLDEEIVALEAMGGHDQLNIRRLKKKKLALKDQITAVEDQLLPDIIA